MKEKKTRKQVRLCICGRHPEKRSKEKLLGGKKGFLICRYAPKNTMYLLDRNHLKYFCDKCGQEPISCFCGRVRLST